MDGDGVSSGGEIVVLIVVVVVVVVAELGYWWWRRGDGDDGDRLCKGGRCYSWRNAIVKLLVVVVMAVVGGGGVGCVDGSGGSCGVSGRGCNRVLVVA